jgi:cell division protein FtsN
LQDPLKERLTGAAILVFVVVLAVPAMFRGRPDGVAPAIDPVANATPLHTYTLVDDGPAAQPQPQAPLQPESPAPSQPLSPPQPPQQPPPQALPQQVAPQQAAPPQAAPQQVAPQQAAPQQAAPQHAAPTPEPAPAARWPVDTKPARAAASKGGWAVQVGSFHVRELAERMAREANAKGFKVHVAGPDERGLYRVRSALQADKEAALALRQQMVARGFKPIINASP